MHTRSKEGYSVWKRESNWELEILGRKISKAYEEPPGKQDVLVCKETSQKGHGSLGTFKIE